MVLRCTTFKRLSKSTVAFDRWDCRLYDVAGCDRDMGKRGCGPRKRGFFRDVFNKSRGFTVGSLESSGSEVIAFAARFGSWPWQAWLELWQASAQLPSTSPRGLWSTMLWACWPVTARNLDRVANRRWHGCRQSTTRFTSGCCVDSDCRRTS